MPNSTTPKLIDTQLVILSSASQREDWLAVVPDGVKGAAAKTAVTKLIGLGLVKETRVTSSLSRLGSVRRVVLRESDPGAGARRLSD
jgi:hypothetical protein